jgi:hypothetical protein
MLGRPLRTVVTITTGPGSSKRGGLTQLGGNKPSYFLDSRREGPRSAAKWSAPWKRSFCASGQDRNGTVSCRGHRHPRSPTARVFGVAPGQRLVPPPTWPELASAALVATAAFPTGSAVEARQSDRSCLVASGEASGSERPRLPPQVSPQPTHPVRQNVVRHSEVTGDTAVMPAVYNRTLGQRLLVLFFGLDSPATNS